jgi:hypothetical protein
MTGNLFAVGGYDGMQFLNTVERYCPIEDKWSFVSSMKEKRSRLALTTCNSKLYAIGGNSIYSFNLFASSILNSKLIKTNY